MKKFIAYLLVALMCMSSLVACGGDKDGSKDGSQEASADLDAAVKIIKTMYLKEKGAETPNDFTVVPQVKVGDTVYEIEWTVDNDAVKIVEGEKAVTIDVNDKNPEEVKYKLTATVKDEDGNTASQTFEYTVPAFLGYDKIVNDAYALQPGESLDGQYTLEGMIVSVDVPYDDGYKNVTVTIKIEGLEDKPIQCFRIKGEGADTIKAGDTITVTGELTNYGGKIQFNAGASLDKVVVGEDLTPPLPTVPEGATMEQIVDAAYELISGQKFETSYTLTGVIKKVDTAYSPDYGNVTVTIQVGDKADKLIMCYRLKGEGADTIKVGDTITVSGYIKNYNGTIEFDAECTLDKVVAGNGGTTQEPSKEPEKEPEKEPADTTPTTMKEIVNAAYALEKDTALDGTYTLTGVITTINTPYDSGYKNVTVTIVVDGMKDKPIMCYRLKGDEASKLGLNDEITVTGKLKNYYGTVEFDAGCTIDKWVDKEEPKAVYTTPEEIVNAAWALEKGATLEGGLYTLTGVITKVDTPYDSGYKNVTVTIVIDGMDDKPIVCFRLKGDGADTIKVGDTITVHFSVVHNVPINSAVYIHSKIYLFNGLVFYIYET